LKSSVLEWLEKTALCQPEKTAFSDMENEISFSELQNKAKAVGSGLALFCQDNTPIAVFTGRNINTIAGFLGVVYSGHAYAPIDAALPDARIKNILTTLSPQIIVADKQNIEHVKLLAGNIKVLELEELFSSKINDILLKRIRDNATISDPLYIIFTSGSTGNPKGVITSHESLMCYIDAYVTVMGIDGTDVLGNQSPLDYIAAVRDIYIPLKTGAKTFIIPKGYFMEPDRLFRLMNKNKISSVGWSVSAFTILSSLGAFAGENLTTLKKICFSGSVMPSRVLRLFQTNLENAKFVNQYGPTEATASCTYYEVDHIVNEDEVLPIGRPYKNYRILILDENDKEVKEGGLGEICVLGPILALGYYNSPEKTAESFIQNPCQPNYFERMYRTGDIGRLRDDGLLEFHGRKDRQIKHMGHRVELDEIEFATTKIDGVKECCCIYNLGKETICLLYTGNALISDVAKGLRMALPGFMVPRKIVNTDAIPRLPNGKIDANNIQNYFKIR